MQAYKKAVCSTTLSLLIMAGTNFGGFHQNPPNKKNDHPPN